MSLPGRFLNIGGQRVFYHRSGGGRPLVLLHGILVSHYVWRHMLPGFGESDRPASTEYRYDVPAFLDTLIGVLDELGLERADLMGHALGGGIALYAAARRPDRVDHVVALDPLVYPARVSLEEHLLLTPFLGPLVFRAAYTKTGVKRMMERSIYGDSTLLTDEWVDYVWERLNRPGGHEAARKVLELHATPSAIARSLRAVRAPTLVVWGADDRLMPSSWAAKLAAEIPGAQSRVIPACGHAPHEEKPEELLEVVLPFLTGLEAHVTAVMS